MKSRATRPPARGRTAVALLLAATVAACGDDPTDLDLLDPDLVVGTYDPTTLTFDVAGQTFGEYDLLAGFEGDQVPPLLIISSDSVAQLVFLNPTTGRFEIGEGSYTMLEDGIRIAFNNAGPPGQLLLPQTLDLTYEPASRTLFFAEDIQAPLARLVSLVPELEGEPLSDPLAGLLNAEFTPR